MNELFLKIVNMSISASWLVLAVLLLRFLFKKAPRWVNVLLWGIVAVRLILPFSIESTLSLIPSTETISLSSMTDKTPSVQTGISALNSVIDPMIASSLAPAPGASANPLQIWIPILGMIWATGTAVLLLYTAVSYWLLRHNVREATLLKDNIFQSETVCSPFVLGIIRPKVYLPYKLDGQALDYAAAHEQAHIRRRDHWWKPLGFLLLSIYWFNPLMWLAYVLLCRDIELACDEKVIKSLDNGQRADYAQTLVACSVNRPMITACPLAFGEAGVKERVKSVMNYKKPAFWIIVLAVIACAVVAVCFLTNPVRLRFDEASHAIISASPFDFRTADDPAAAETDPAQLRELSGGMDIPAASGTAGGKTYVYENEGIMGSFAITLYEDGTFFYSEGIASSYIGIGTWTQDDDAITLTDKETAGYIRTNYFRIDGGDLVFLAEDSSNFIYVKVQNGERFHCTDEAPWADGAADIPKEVESKPKLTLDDVIALSKKGMISPGMTLRNILAMRQVPAYISGYTKSIKRLHGL